MGTCPLRLSLFFLIPSIYNSVKNELFDRGLIYKGKHAGWYSVSDECFYTDKQVVDGHDPKTKQKARVAKETGNVVVHAEEENYMFKLSSFSDRLMERYLKNPDGLSPRTSFIAEHRPTLTRSHISPTATPRCSEYPLCARWPARSLGLTASLSLVLGCQSAKRPRTNHICLGRCLDLLPFWRWLPLENRG